jgi:hypothetical protein
MLAPPVHPRRAGRGGVCHPRFRRSGRWHRLLRRHEAGDRRRHPGRAEGLSAAAVSGHEVNLTWTDNSNIEVGYQIEQSPDGENDWVPVAWTDANTVYHSLPGPFAPNTDYYFRVKAFAESAESQYSNVADVTTAAWPEAPTGLFAWASSDTQIELAWVDNSGGADIVLERSADGIVWSDVTISDNESATDSGLTPGSTYLYRVFASDVGGESGYATTTATAIGAPTGLSATAVSGHEIYLEWEDNSDIEWGFWIEQSLNGTDGWFVVDWAGEDAEEISLAGPFDPSTAYYFRVAAYSGWDVSAYSGVASDTTAAFPAYPTELVATTVSTTRIDLAWVDNAADELGYILQRSLDGEEWSDVPIIDHESANDTGVLAGNVYQYRVFAYNAAGKSGYSTAQAATVPGAPANLTATPLDAWRIELDWDDPSGNSPVFYSVFAGTSPGFTPGPENMLVSELWSSEWTVEELEPLTSYYFKVMATDLYDQTSTACGCIMREEVYATPSSRSTARLLTRADCKTGLGRHSRCSWRRRPR